MLLSSDNEAPLISAHYANGAFTELQNLQPNLTADQLIELTKASSVFALTRELSVLTGVYSDNTELADSIKLLAENIRYLVQD